MLTLDHFTEDDEAVLRKMFDVLLRQDNEYGGVAEVKTDARRSGFSLHVKFNRQVSVFITAEVAKVYDDSPDKLFLVLRKLLAVPDDYEPPPR